MKNFIERYAEKKLTTKEEPKKDEVKKEDKSEQKSEAKSDEKKDEAKDGKPEEEQKDKKSENKSEDKSEPEKAETSNPEPDETKATKPEPEKAEAPKGTATPAPTGYTGAGDISGVKDLQQKVTINGDVSITQYGGTPLTQPAVGAKLDAFVKSIEAIKFTRAEEDSFRNGDALYELNRATSEGEVPSSAIKFAELTFLKCPQKASKFIRDHISEAIEADPELLQFIREADARKHQIERRFRPFRAEVASELWDEATARPYITEQKAGLPPRLAENARDDDFGTWVLVELNADTGAIRELSAEEAKAYEAKQTTAEPNKKPNKAKKGEA